MESLPLSDYTSAVEAMRILRVRPQTLYAYVSRGWIRSVAQPGRKDKLYLREDLLRIGSRSAARAGHGAVAAAAMNWGEPIVATAITEITEAGPRYRGRLATDLALAGTRFEAVAELLWTGQLPATEQAWAVAKPSAEVMALGQQLSSGLFGGNLLESFAMLVLLLGMGRGSIADRLTQGQTVAAARQVLHTVVGCCGFAGHAGKYVPMRRGENIVQGLMRALDVPPTDENHLALESVLILLADHELSPGALNARVVASGGGTLHSCIAAALCASSGVDIGRVYERVELFLGRARSASVLSRRTQRLLGEGKAVPGFYHPLYPKGDPRARHLIEIAARRREQTEQSRAVFRFVKTMQQTSTLFPSHELATVLLTRMMGLPAHVPMALFAVARTSGWVAHVLEQRASGTLLRPRAKFEQVLRKQGQQPPA